MPKKNRFVGETLGPADWKKPKHIREAIAERNRRLLASRAFCPTGQGGGVDNSCSSKDGGGGGSSEGSSPRAGKKPNKPLARWRDLNSQSLAKLRSKIAERGEASRQERKEIQREIMSLYSLIDGISDVHAKARNERKEAREALRKALMDSSVTPDTRAYWEKLPAGMIEGERRVGKEWESEETKAALAKVSEKQEQLKKVFDDTRRHEEALAQRKESLRKSQQESAKSLWEEVGRFAEERATSDPASGISKERFDSADKFFEQGVKQMYVDARTTQETERNFRDNTKRDVETFLASTVSPTSMAAQSLINAVTVVDSNVERAYAKNNEVWLHPNSSQSTYAHELGHVIEMGDRDVLSAAVAFRDSRCSDSDDVKMSEKFPDRGFREDEVGNKDNFDKTTKAVFGELFQEGAASSTAHYIGKVYRPARSQLEPLVVPEPSATEIVSVGMEMLYHAPDRFAEADPEYFDFMVGILSGSAGSIKKDENDIDSIYTPHRNPSAPRDGDGDGITNEEEKNKGRRR